MADYTRSAHLALLARAKAALAPHAASAGISDLIADLEAAVGRIQQTPVPWPVPVYLALIGHGHGTSVAAAVSHKGLLDQVAVFCRSQWGEINDDRDPASLDASLVVRDYFNRHPEDRLVSLEIGNYLALSSRHISWPTTLTIDEWMTRDPSDRPVSIADTHYGWLICTVPSSFGDRSAIPDDLTDTLSFAQEKGCDYLILDRDASTTDRLPCFEW
jgi:hypothetical protein